jgi:hypothetical protein
MRIGQFNPSAWVLRGAATWLVLMLLSCAGKPERDPAMAARVFFDQHFDFDTLEDIGAVADAVTPDFHALLSRMVNGGYPLGYFVSACAWTDSQDGWFKEDPVFTVVRNDGKRAVVRMDYDFEIGSTVEPKRTLLTLEWDSTARRWKVADLEGPDGHSYFQSNHDFLKRLAEEDGIERSNPDGGGD